MLGAAAALIVAIGLVVGGVVAVASRGSGPGEETVASTGSAGPTTPPSVPPTSETTQPPVADAPNLVAFTLADEAAELTVGREREFTVRVWNKPRNSGDVGASEGGTLTVDLSGDAAELVGGGPGCTEGAGSLSCTIRGLPVDGKANVKVTLRGLSEGSARLSFAVLATGSTEAFEDSTRFTVTTDTCTVPNVVAQTVDDARAALEQAGLAAQVETVPSDAPPGIVIQTDPTGGKEPACGSTVTLQVSSGP